MKKWLFILSAGTLLAGVSAGVDGAGVDVNVGGPYYYDDGYYYDTWYGPGWYYGTYYYDSPSYYSWRSRHWGGHGGHGRHGRHGGGHH